MDGLELLVLRSADMAAARRFYECLGFRFRVERHGGGPEHYSAAGSSGVLELYPARGGVPDSAGLGFVVQDLAAVVELLCTAGFAPGGTSEGWNGSSLVVRDPDGRRVELRQAPRTLDPQDVGVGDYAGHAGCGCSCRVCS